MATPRSTRSPSVRSATQSEEYETPPPLNQLHEEVEEVEAEKRVSFYVEAVDEMLSAVLSGGGKESFLFTAVERAALERFMEMDYEPRYLFIRLYLRKPGWIRQSQMQYKEDIDNMTTACQALCEVAPPLAGGSGSKAKQTGDVIDLTESDDEMEDEIPMDVDVEGLRYFAHSEKELAECKLVEILNVLTVEELASLGNKLKVKAVKSNRRRWTEALIKTSSQAVLSFSPSASKRTSSVGMGYDAKGNKIKQSSRVKTAALQDIGSCLRISPAYVRLFDRLSLIYHRKAHHSSSSNMTALTASLLSHFGKRNYPVYKVSRSFSIFPSRAVLLQFEEALEIERRIAAIADGQADTPALNSSGRKEQDEELWNEAITLFGEKEVMQKWKVFCEEGQKELEEEERTGVSEEKRLLYYRKRFHPGWPLTRVIYKIAHIYSRLKEYTKEAELLRSLIGQNVFRRGQKGKWYDRLALNLMTYPRGKELEETTSEDRKVRLATKRFREALKVASDGLGDIHTHIVYHSSLQRRIVRLQNTLKFEKEEKRSFPPATKASSRIFVGVRVDEPEIGKKSIWELDEEEEGIEVEGSVEEFALQEYAKLGWKGIHSENGILTMIFALLFWDILFADRDGVFETPYQSAPLDLSSDAFFTVRATAIEKRLQRLRDGKARSIIRQVDNAARPKAYWVVGVNWEKYSLQVLLEIVDCLGGEALGVICTLFAQEYGHRSGGAPDLCLWNPQDETILFAEVKGPGDRLSETQKVWLDVLTRAGVACEVCHVMTKEQKEEKDARDAEAKEKAAASRLKRKREKESANAEDDEDE